MSLMMYGLMRGAGAAAPAGGGGSSTDLLTLNSGLSGTAGYKYWDHTSNYLGGFRFPYANYGGIPGDNLNYTSQPSIGIGSSSSKLFIAGRDRGGTKTVTTFAEFTIPALSTSGTLSSLNIASNSQNFVEALTGAPVDTSSWSEGRVLAGMYTINGMVICTAYGYYTSTDTPLIVLDSATSLSTASKRGYFDLAARQNFGGWITAIPSYLQSAFSGSHLIGFSSAGSRAILSKYSIGPSAAVIDVSSSTSITGASPPSNGSTLSVTPVLNYPLPDSLTPEADLDLSGQYWTNCSGAEVGFIVPGTRTYMCIGTSAGHSSGSTYWDPHPPWDDYKGYGPLSEPDRYNYYWLFDTDDMLAVKAGTMAIADVLPYEQGAIVFAFDNGPGDTTLHWIAGATHDPSNNRLYVCLDRADNSQASESTLPLCVVYDLSEIAA